MARVRMVTRTINVTTITCICMDIKTMETSFKDFDVTGDKLTQEKALSLAKKTYETDDFKIVAVQSLTTSEELYGLLETDFIKYAQKLDPATRKMLELTDDEVTF